MLRTMWIWILEKLWSEWQQVGTFQTEIEIKEDSWEKVKYTVFIHCFESKWGLRREEIQIQRAGWFHGSWHKKIRRGTLYQTEVYPWLNYRQHTKIPGFEEVKSKKFDFKKALAGETPVVLNDDEKS